MTDLRTAAQQALEALERTDKISGYANNKKVITALRAALAQQAEPVLQGPVRIKPGSYTLGATWVGGGGGSGGVGAPPQQAEPVACRNTFGCRCPKHFAVEQAEPVADPFADIRDKRMGELNAEQTDRATELWLREQIGPREDYWYPHLQTLFRIIDRLRAQAAPPQRKPLTEEEIESCRQQGYAHGGLSAPFDFGKAARAVERAHGIPKP